jgi:hypothetical protein
MTAAAAAVKEVSGRGTDEKRWNDVRLRAA